MLRELNIENSLTISKSINWQKREVLECRIYEPEAAWNCIDDNLFHFHTDLPTSISLFNDKLCIARGDVPNKLNDIIFNFLFALDEIKSDCDFKVSNEEKKFLLSDIKKFFEFLKCLTNEFLEVNDLVSFKSLCDFLLKWLYHMGDIVENMMEIRTYDNISEVCSSLLLISSLISLIEF
uniref:NR LBD domain-containing protein n=1 Tax=Strongyloides papillosus TaxID=174720 RepID=A0A0N5B814_STREA